VEIDEKIDQADDGKDHPAVWVTVCIGGVVIHSILLAHESVYYGKTKKACQHLHDRPLVVNNQILLINR
jgi:hypothetical protein